MKAPVHCLGISHPGAMGNYERARGAVPDVPSVLVYCSNMKKDPFDFIGDFVYDEPRRDEKFSTVSTIVCNCVERFRTAGSTPTRLVIYRNGTSEGQFGMSLQYEIPLIHHALNQMNAADCKLTVLVSQKAHNIRLFMDPMPTRSEITLPNGVHLAIQGTARTPRYSVLLDENKFSMDVIEGFTYALSLPIRL
uniref:Piwi domain-containing protein n=1 Tax=Ditylenchus dipsaci TaxID=166011 RepID=A0A915D8A0_9BILA